MLARQDRQLKLVIVLDKFEQQPHSANEPVMIVHGCESLETLEMETTAHDWDHLANIWHSNNACFQCQRNSRGSAGMCKRLVYSTKPEKHVLNM